MILISLSVKTGFADRLFSPRTETMESCPLAGHDAPSYPLRRFYGRRRRGTLQSDSCRRRAGKKSAARGKNPAAAVVVQDGVRLAFALFLGRLHLFPNRGVDDNLAVGCSRPRLVDNRDPAFLDLDLPHCSPRSNLVVCGVEEIRELVAFQLVRSRVGVHRVEQLDALLIRHLGGALRLRALVAQDYAHHPPVRSEGDVAVGRLAAT